MEQWRKLSHKLTRKEVRKLLGEPLRVELDPVGQSHDHPKERWTYEYHDRGEPDRRTQGEITISITQGHVLHWTEPDWARLNT